MANEIFKGVVRLPSDDAYKTLIDTGVYSDGEKEITYNPNWLYVTPNTVASNIEQQKLQIADLYEKASNTVTLDSVQTITGPKTFRESIYLANADGTTDRIAHINNNFIIYSGANNGVALLNIDEGLGKISAFNKELAFKDDIPEACGGGTGNTTVYVDDTAVEEVRFDSDPQTQINNINTNLTENYVKNTDYATATKAGLTKLYGETNGRGYGLNRDRNNNGIYVAPASYSHIDSRVANVSPANTISRVNDFTPITSAVIDYAVQQSLVNSKLVEGYEWDDEDKAKARATLGIDLSTKLDKTGGTLTGGLSVNGNLTIVGDITQQGSAYVSHAEQVYSTKDYIYLREGNTGALAEGAYTGFEFIKYDGTNNGRLVVDNKGIARVGDVGDEQPLATREETPINEGFAKWDANVNKFVTTTDVASKTTTDSLSQQLGTFAVELANTQQDVTDNMGDISDLDARLSTLESAGSGKKYMHNIRARGTIEGHSIVSISCSFITDTSDAFTKNTFQAYLYNNGYYNYESVLPASGGIQRIQSNDTQTAIISGLYSQYSPYDSYRDISYAGFLINGVNSTLAENTTNIFNSSEVKFYDIVKEV